MLDAKNLWLVNTAYGIVEGTPDTNPQMVAESGTTSRSSITDSGLGTSIRGLATTMAK
jgi:hypothetical protein